MIDVTDELVCGYSVLELIAQVLRLSFLALINGGNAHSSYWHSQKVADRIQSTIRSVTVQQSTMQQPMNSATIPNCTGHAY